MDDLLGKETKPVPSEMSETNLGNRTAQPVAPRVLFLTGMLTLLLVGWLFGATFIVYSAIAVGSAFWINRFLATRWSKAVALERKLLRGEIRVGEVVDVGVVVKNRSRWYIPWLLVEDYLSRRTTLLPPKSLELQGTAIRLVMMKPGQQLLLQYRLKALRRGYFQIGPSVVETGDFLGLHRRFHIGTKPQYLLVLPKLIPLAAYEVGSRRPIGEIRVSYRSLEDPTLMTGLRDYLQGDSLNRIHWRATARTGKLQSKVFQPTTLAGAMLLVDLHARSNPSQQEPVRTDLAVTAAASIAHAIYHMRQPFGLISNGCDARDRIRWEGWESDYRTRTEALKSIESIDSALRLRPVIVERGQGPNHFVQVHQTLATLERSNGLELSQLILETQHRMPRDTTVLAIVQQLDDAAALALGLIRRQGFSVAAIVNRHETSEFYETAGKLAAYKIPAYHLRDEASIPLVCQSALFGIETSSSQRPEFQLI